MAENVASPLEKDFVLKKIKEYENFVKLKLEPKIQDLEKSKVELTLSVKCRRYINRFHHESI